MSRLMTAVKQYCTMFIFHPTPLPPIIRMSRSGCASYCSINVKSSKLIGKLQEKGLALIPLKIYFKSNGKAKIELGLARGKRQYDKRAALKEKQSNREIQREMRRRPRTTDLLQYGGETDSTGMCKLIVACRASICS